MGKRGYSFGDSDLAAERLALVARVFEQPLRTFLERSAPKKPRLALDLGCGLGHTTALVAEVASPERTVGIDISESFLEQARARAGAGIEFIRHDVTVAPFPAGPADLIFARLLLGHLTEPESLIAAWVGERAPGGVLLSDEVEQIETQLKQFARYLALVERRMRASGGELYLGPKLDALRYEAGLRRLSSDLVHVSPSTADAAAMFLLNLRVLRAGGRWESFATAAELDRIERELDELTQSMTSGEIVWALRQTVFAAT
ncbi:MAG: class I SAM-dependent methyltransferase [Gaiellaceae bacterium]|jgi:SAM-dependent methyltransferase